MKYREEGEGCRLPKYVRREFEGYLKWGLLERIFLRVLGCSAPAVHC